MTVKQRISVAEWSEADVAVVLKGDTHRPLFSPVVIGLAGSLILHGLALQTVVLGSRARVIRKSEVLEPGSALSTAKSADALVFIELPKTAKTTNDVYEALASVRASLKNTRIPLIHSDPLPPLDIETLGEDENSESSADNGDGAERARLLGIYTGQIRARIERVWRRPRTPVEEGSDSAKNTGSTEYFRCQVQIVQDSTGNVQEILLPDCNGSVAWQRSLVTAIRQSSPLPTPLLPPSQTTKATSAR